MIDIATPVNLRKDIAYIEGGVASKQLLKCKEGNVTLFAFDEGQGLTEHTSPYDALVQVIEGEAVISIAGKPNSLNEGEVILMPANIPHAVFAGRKFKMILTMIKCSD